MTYFAFYCSVIAGASNLHLSTTTGATCSAVKKGGSFSFNIGLNDCGTVVTVCILSTNVLIKALPKSVRQLLDTLVHN